MSSESIVCKTRLGKKRKIFYQWAPGSDRYVSLEDIMEAARDIGSPVPTRRTTQQRLYNGHWPYVVAQMGFPVKGPKTKHEMRRLARRAKQRASDKPGPTGQRETFDRSKNCFRRDGFSQVRCKHYHKWLSDAADFKCECSGFEGDKRCSDS